MAERRNVRAAEWQSGGIAERRNGRVVEWENSRMGDCTEVADWQQHKDRQSYIERGERNLERQMDR